MKLQTSVVLGLTMLSIQAFAQGPTDPIEIALKAAPLRLKDNATVIKWKPDFTYETLRKGTNRLVCYDRSGQPASSRLPSNAQALATWTALPRT